MVALLKLALLSVACGFAGAWLGTLLIYGLGSSDSVSWQAPLPFTLVGAFLLGLAYAYVRDRRLRGVASYAFVIGIGAVAGGLMLLPFGSTGLAVAGVGYGFITALIWVGTHYLIRDVGSSTHKDSSGAANG